MTIAIKITNDDSRETAIVEVGRVNQDATNTPVAQLKGGESVTDYVHSGQSLTVKEIQNG